MFGIDTTQKQILAKQYQAATKSNTNLDTLRKCKMLGSLTINIPISKLNQSGCCGAIDTKGIWEGGTTKLIHDLVKPGMVCVDAGAHVGYFTILMSALLGNTGRVYSIEANPTLIPVIETSILSNVFTNVTIHNYALHERDNDTVNLSVPVGSGGGSSIIWKAKNELESFDVQTITLDTLVPEKIDLIKIDVEGSYPYVWNGMRKHLERNPNMHIVIEMSYKAKWLCEEIERDFDIYHNAGWDSLIKVDKVGKLSNYYLVRKAHNPTLIS